jgi:hypothetical protein
MDSHRIALKYKENVGLLKKISLFTYDSVSGVRCLFSCFGCLEVPCWPLEPKFAGSNPAEAVGFLRLKKIPQHTFLSEVK